MSSVTFLSDSKSSQQLLSFFPPKCSNNDTVPLGLHPGKWFTKTTRGNCLSFVSHLYHAKAPSRIRECLAAQLGTVKAHFITQLVWSGLNRSFQEGRAVTRIGGVTTRSKRVIVM